MRIAPILLACLCLVAGCSLPGQAQANPPKGETIGCRGCPTFAPVPPPPAAMRRISHVATTELTWNQYLAAYDAGACPIPRSDHDLLGETPRREFDEHIELFRIDWPATKLGPSEIQCYAEWLSTELGREVAVPTAEEWLWFARSGVEGRRYPWGDEAEPGLAAIGGLKAIREGLRDNEVRVPYPDTYRLNGKFVLPHLTAIKVAQYPPTEWGLYDIFGNAEELTADISPWAAPTGSPVSDALRGAMEARVMGQSHGLVEWQEAGLDDEKPRYVLIAGGRYSASVAVRYVLID